MDAYVSLAPYYDELTGDVPYGSFADFYEAVFRMYGASPKLLLDLACGTGTLTAELTRRGYELIAADVSPDMLSIAREKAAGLEPEPVFLNQSMEELDLYGTVDAAVCSLDGVNYLPPESLGGVFERLRLFVAPGGLFIFDVNTPEKLRSLDGQVFLDEREDVYCVWRAELTDEPRALVYGMDVFAKRPDGTYDRGWEEHVEYIHTVEELKRELSAHGFEDIRVFGELRLEPPEENEQRIFIAARRG